MLTLAALVASLLGFGPDGGAATRSDVLLDRLGIALSTTFVGLIFRTAMVEFSTPDEDKPRLAGNQFGNAMREFGEALRMGQRQIQDTLSDINESLRTSAQEQSNAITAQREASIQDQREVIDAFRKRLEGMTLIPKKTMDQYDAAAERLAGQIDGVAGSLEQLQTESGKSAVAMNRLANSAPDALNTLTRQCEVIAKASETVSKQATADLQESMTRLSEAVHAFENAASSVENPFMDIAQSLPPILENMEKLVATIQGTSRLAAQMDSHLKNVEALDTAVTNASTAFEKLMEEAGAFSGLLEEQKKAARKAIEGLVADRSTYQEQHTALMQDLVKQREEAKDATEDFVTGFSDLIKRIETAVRQ